MSTCNTKAPLPLPARAGRRRSPVRSLNPHPAQQDPGKPSSRCQQRPSRKLDFTPNGSSKAVSEGPATTGDLSKTQTLIT